MGSDFPVTRQTLERMDDWVMALAAPILPPEPIPIKLAHLAGFQWRFREKNERALLVGKAIRMVSGLRAAFMLAEFGYIAESGTLLRTVSDFANEVISICEGYAKGSPTSDQKKFVEQYFAPMATDLDEYEYQSRERWVTRKQMLAGTSGGQLRREETQSAPERFLAFCCTDMTSTCTVHILRPWNFTIL